MARCGLLIEACRSFTNVTALQMVVMLLCTIFPALVVGSLLRAAQEGIEEPESVLVETPLPQNFPARPGHVGCDACALALRPSKGSSPAAPLKFTVVFSGTSRCAHRLVRHARLPWRHSQ